MRRSPSRKSIIWLIFLRRKRSHLSFTFSQRFTTWRKRKVRQSLFFLIKASKICYWRLFFLNINKKFKFEKEFGKCVKIFILLSTASRKRLLNWIGTLGGGGGRRPRPDYALRVRLHKEGEGKLRTFLKGENASCERSLKGREGVNGIRSSMRGVKKAVSKNRKGAVHWVGNGYGHRGVVLGLVGPISFSLSVWTPPCAKGVLRKFIKVAILKFWNAGNHVVGLHIENNWNGNQAISFRNRNWNEKITT